MIGHRTLNDAMELHGLMLEIRVTCYRAWQAKCIELNYTREFPPYMEKIGGKLSIAKAEKIANLWESNKDNPLGFMQSLPLKNLLN